MKIFNKKIMAVITSTLLLSSCSANFLPSKAEVSTSEETSRQIIESEMPAQENDEVYGGDDAPLANKAKNLVGDMTIKNAYKLSYKSDEFTPALVNGKIVTINPVGEPLCEFTMDDEMNTDKVQIREIEIGVTDPVSGDYKAVYSDVMVTAFINITPLSDDGTFILKYYDESCTPKDTSKTIWYDDILKNPNFIEISVNDFSTEKLDLSNCHNVFQINSVGNNLFITANSDDPVSQSDFEGRGMDPEYYENTTEAMTLYYYLLNRDTKEIKQIQESKLYNYMIKKGEDKIDRIYVYDEFVVGVRMKYGDNDMISYILEIYDTNMNLIYSNKLADVTAEDYYGIGGYILVETGVSQGDIYVSITGQNRYDCYKYSIKDGKYEKEMVENKPDPNQYSYFQYSNRAHNFIDYNIMQITDDGDGLAKLSLYNPCTCENVNLLINIDGFKAPDLMHGNTGFNGDQRGDIIVAGNGSDAANNMEYWYVPREEIARALYG